MLNIEQKVIKKTVSSVGDIEIMIAQVGCKTHLKSLEDFIKYSDERFHLIMMRKRQINDNTKLQNAIQHFVNHVQESGIEEATNRIQAHFKNWLYAKNDQTLIEIISTNPNQINNGTESSNNSDESTISNERKESDRIKKLREW